MLLENVSNNTDHPAENEMTHFSEEFQEISIEGSVDDVIFSILSIFLTSKFKMRNQIILFSTSFIELQDQIQSASNT